LPFSPGLWAITSVPDKIKEKIKRGIKKQVDRSEEGLDMRLRG
jgi:hypothetical protein